MRIIVTETGALSAMWALAVPQAPTWSEDVDAWGMLYAVVSACADSPRAFDTRALWRPPSPTPAKSAPLWLGIKRRP